MTALARPPRGHNGICSEGAESRARSVYSHHGQCLLSLPPGHAGDRRAGSAAPCGGGRWINRAILPAHSQRGSSQAAVVCAGHSPLHQNQPRFVKAWGKTRKRRQSDVLRAARRPLRTLQSQSEHRGDGTALSAPTEQMPQVLHLFSGGCRAGFQTRKCILFFIISMFFFPFLNRQQRFASLCVKE